MANLYVAWPRVKDSGALEAYVRTSMARTAISWRRRRSRRPEVLVEAIPDSAPDVARAPSAAEARLDVLAALRSLPPRQRAVVVLRYYDDLSEREIAAALGCSEGSVKTHASCGLTALRRLLHDGYAHPTTGGSAEGVRTGEEAR